jgi:cell division protein FtsZ
MKLEEFSQIGNLVAENLSNDATVIIGARINKEFEGKVRVITIMTGVKSPYVLGREREETSRNQMSKEMSDLGIDVFR